MSTNAQNGLPPAVKDWLDRCLVPILVQEYMAKVEKEGKVEATDRQEVSR